MSPFNAVLVVCFIIGSALASTITAPPPTGTGTGSGSGFTGTAGPACCQTYTALPWDPLLTICPSSKVATTIATQGLNTTVYDLCTAHCAGKPTPGVPVTSTTCPVFCTFTTTYGTGPPGTTTGYTVSNPDIEGTNFCTYTPPSTGTATPTSTTTSPTTSPIQTTTLPGQVHYGQCGGIGYSGPTACVSGYTCSAIAPTYYSQKLGELWTLGSKKVLEAVRAHYHKDKATTTSMKQ
ncbi:hypothetical protein SISNIDRAFT_485038 [Sistotremastrum niveocremeum HHB9708]|uniref:CBM1 domain-containing protein n=1 Tax=Sistotremastrum niveocremeum HHB9708 TaxID=1314777 RepID=A0A164VF57_9AGAM|nr:hypothetical protein SISNIDRAFT_485038 [Sistotremastrum niveocremeum HHB9708]